MRSILLTTTALLLAGPALAATAPAAYADSAAISGLGIRNIGSAEMSGRIAAIAGRAEKDGKTTLYVGAASGGVWKSEDGGTTFRPVFDKQPVASIGEIALDPTNPQTVWVGTGESWTRNSVSIGGGVYKSTDGGETWQLMGLPKTERIVRILVHPKDGNTVYVCAPGPLWSDSMDRGLYKTTDGGRTWTQIIKPANLSTGCSSVAMDPNDPEHLLAGTWDFRRTGWDFRSGGHGPNAPSGSRMMESRDGGRTWTDLNAQTRSGLPNQPWGRVEIAWAPSDPKRVYAFVENVRSALYVSEDGGKTFQERDRSQGMVWRPFYFGRLVVDPKNQDRVFKMGYHMIGSEDGGKSFTDSAQSSHADWHALWIDPTNTRHMIGGDDGGLWLTEDGGTKWRHGLNLPISQFYHVSVDDKDPYQVYGGLQDNSSWVGDQEYPGGITNSRWENLYGGDGFWAFPDPADPDYVYAEYQGGSISRINRKTLEQRDIQPKAGYKEKLRFNWNTPIHMSPNEKGTIYIGSQFLFRSRDHGQSWDRISPDLTTNNPQLQRQEESGGITVDNSAAEMHTTIYSISESPKAAGQIWVGTDDGNVQLTRDGGKSWTNLTKNLKLPKDSWISWVEASRYDPAVAYVTVDRHNSGDFQPYLFRTADYGKTWKPLIGPRTEGVRGYVHVVREDRVDPNILFVGTEFGLFMSLDGGADWAQFKPNNFPDVAVRDLAIQDRDDDLVLATHGRGIWVIDDLSPLRALTPDKLAATAVLIPGPKVQQRIQGNGGWAEGDATYVGENPPDGAVITYYQKARHVIGRMKLEVLDASGNVVDELPASKRRGLNRVVWSMRTKPPQVPPAAQIAFRSTQGERVLPGQYTVRLTKAGEVSTAPMTIGLDRRATFTLADRKAQYDAAEHVKTLFARMSKLVAQMNAARAQAAKVAADPNASPAAKAEAKAFGDKVEALRTQVVATKEGGAITGEERLREHMDYAYGAVTSTEQRPTPYALARVDALEKELSEVEAAWAALSAQGMGKVNAAAAAMGLSSVDLAEVEAEDDGARGGDVDALIRGLVGTRFTGQLAALAGKGEKE
ncbi:sialidase [Sphingomonas sp. MAH-20]|uniref:Sialidase n=1 Tax=Sphingomonas horti TaxID=2682842 RepID=A0A6I4IX22_9SPHN|nr:MULTISPECIES: sialidase family protein [Sphingomonas]MBA2920390.1 sialidase [Sphingomonas sp. CGMCC 1.13658]MVO76644.1 sialidase [Sphingomonas horti]